MERMTPQDASFLYLEDENNPMHIGSVAVFAGPPPPYGDFIRMIAGKLPLVPRYRQRVRFVPFGFGRPVWGDDPHFQILYHVRHSAVPSPGGSEQLRNLAGRVLAQRLDRTKPLWEMWLVEGLEDGRWALISKVHHCMVDGVSGTDLLSVLLDKDPRPVRAAPGPSWSPEPELGTVRLLADALNDGLRSPVQRLQALPALAGLLAQPGEQLELLRAIAQSFLSRPRPAVHSLNGPVGPHRRWSWAQVSLEQVKTVRQGLGGTVNDVVLAAITRGFRDLLLARGEPVDGRVVRTLVPVSVRGQAERGTFNNRVSAVFPELPVGLADPVERLEDIRLQMDGLKESRQAVAGEALTRMSGFAPALLLDLAARLSARFPQRLVQTVTTNVPGPQFPLYAVGRRLLEAYPYVPLGGHIRIGVAIFSYVGRLSFGITGDFDTSPDVDVLCHGIEVGMEELVAAASLEPEPGRAKATAGPRGRRRRTTRPLSEPDGPPAGARRRSGAR